MECEFLSHEELKSAEHFDNHEGVCRFSDPESGIRGYVAIHNTTRGPAVGGSRMRLYPSDEAALDDALRLSSAMSSKCALAGLPYGGGKAVIIGDPRRKTRHQLAAYGRVIEYLDGALRTGVDVGLSDADVAEIARHTRFMIGVLGTGVEKLGTAEMAAASVYHALKAAWASAHGTPRLRGARITIKGVGKLGGELLRLTHLEGAHVTIADVDERRVAELAEHYPGTTVADWRTVHALDADVFAPCALGNDVGPETIGGLRVTIVCGGANNQLTEPRMGEELHRRGILYCPDYLVNVGGLVNVVDELELDGYRKERVITRIEETADRMSEIITESRDTGQPTSVVADQMAQRILTHKSG